MIQYRKFIFNPFAVNTYVLWDETHRCAIIDPGMVETREYSTLFSFIESNKLEPEVLLLTHCHLDHVLGWEGVHKKYGLVPQFSFEDGESCRRQNTQYLTMFGLDFPPIPSMGQDLSGGTAVKFGQSELQVLDTPGHSAAGLSFFHAESKLLVSGDVLFHLSIGRTDLDGGDFNVLSHSIREKIFPLGDDVKVLPGHMDETYVGYEKKHNPFVRGY